MIPNIAIQTLKALVDKYQLKGYQQNFVIDEGTNKYELRLMRDGKTIVIRDGFYEGNFSKGEVKLTSFDVLLTLEGFVFAQYFSDYPLEEYNSQLEEATKLIDAFDAGNYDITSEKSFFGKKKMYLNINVDGEAQHLLGKQLN